jgi:hypothetical protein
MHNRKSIGDLMDAAPEAMQSGFPMR